MKIIGRQLVNDFYTFVKSNPTNNNIIINAYVPIVISIKNKKEHK